MKQERPTSSLCWPWKNLLPESLLGATLADHLQAGDAQFTEFLFPCRFLNLALFLFFCLRFAAGRTGSRSQRFSRLRETPNNLSCCS